MFGSSAGSLEDTSSGPGAPDLELVCANLAFCEHGFRGPPAGEMAFTIVRSFFFFLGPDSGVLIPTWVVLGPRVVASPERGTCNDRVWERMGERDHRAQVRSSPFIPQLKPHFFFLGSYFSTPNDIKTLIQGVRLALRVAHTEPLKSKLMFKPNTDESSVFFMGDADPDTVTDAQIEAWLRRNVETIYHPVRLFSVFVFVQSHS